MKTLNIEWAKHVVVAFIVAVALSLTASAQVGQTSFVIASGGGPAIGNGIVANGTIGQPVIGIVIGGGTTLSQGFWFTPRPGGATLGVESGNERAGGLSVVAYPNPCRDNATVEILVPARTRVSARLYDELGNERATLYDRETEAGKLRLNVNAALLSAGHYTLRVVGDRVVRAAPLIVVK